MELLIKHFIFAPSFRAMHNDRVAQLVEHLPFKERVLGSSPSPVTKAKPYRLAFFIFTASKLRTWRNW